MSTRSSSPPAVSAELLQALLGQPAPLAPPSPPTIHINVQQGGSVTLVLAQPAPTGGL